MSSPMRMGWVREMVMPGDGIAERAAGREADDQAGEARQTSRPVESTRSSGNCR